jgi:hypothetical protein
MSKYTYTINKNNELQMFDDGNEVPFIDQPFDPSTTEPWESKEKAEAWAQQLIYSMENPKPYNPQDAIPQVNGQPLEFSVEQQAMIDQAFDDSDRIKRIEIVLMDILKKLS